MRTKTRRAILLAALSFLLLNAAVWTAVIALDRWDASTFQTRIGIPLPAAATEFKSVDVPGWDGGEYWMSARMAKSDFTTFAQAAALQCDPPVLSRYPMVFARCADSPSWWAAGEPPKDQQYFGERPDGYVAAWYENGHIYLRRSTY